jgi:hypothetical protein
MILSEQTPMIGGSHTPNVRVQSCSALAEHNYPGDCSRLHGHSRQVDTHETHVRYLEISA